MISLFGLLFLLFILRLSSGTKFWKIISNCCLPAFLREVLVNYASNMIRIREFLHGLDK